MHPRVSLTKPSIWELDNAEDLGRVRRAIRLYGPQVLTPRIFSGLRANRINKGVTELPW